MSLPGKLCIGILEEDNPLRSYFRFKPLLVCEGDRYVPYDQAQRYPEEGCIRIVPDKNESYHFKARMRRIGLFCVVDLRAHPGESDKIRANKNYRPASEEINASIIYSDVVRAPAPEMIYQVLPAEAGEKPIPEPATPTVLLRGADGPEPALYGWAAIEDSDGLARLTPSEAECPIDAVQVFELPSFHDETVAFAIRPASAMAHVSDMPEKPAAQEPAPVKPDTVKREAGPQTEAAAKSVTSEHSRIAEKRAEQEKADDPEKPWLHHDESMLPPPIDPRLSRPEQLIAAQAGLNPRRGRSLQELIDEKWQRSRLNQLGQPVTPIATGAPVKSPVDIAMEALKDAWAQPQLRQPLLDAISELGDFNPALRSRQEAICQSAMNDELNAMEARRLELSNELDHLKAAGQAVREQLMKQIRRDEADALADAVQRTADARAEQARYEQLAADARMAARDAQEALDQLTGEKLEQKIRDIALTQHVLERLEQLRRVPEAEALPGAPVRVDLETLIDRVTRRFAAEGWTLDRMAAANLCVSLAIGPTLMLSGAPGSGKSTAARLLCEALGLKDIRRAPVFPPDIQPLRHDPEIEALRRLRDMPAVVVLDDANLCPGGDPLRGLAQDLSPEWRLIATLQDAHTGCPVSAGTLDKGFLVRLEAPDALPWRPEKHTAAPAETPVSLSALNDSLPQAEIPEIIIGQMDALRRHMAECGAKVSRRALDDAWRYCGAMIAILGDDADPAAILDLAAAQRLLPELLASAPVDALVRLRDAAGLPACRAMLSQPLPINI